MPQAVHWPQQPEETCQEPQPGGPGAGQAGEGGLQGTDNKYNPACLNILRIFSFKEPVVRRGSLPDILHPHPQHQSHLQHHHWSGSQPNLESDLLMASSASTGNLHLMSGGGLVTTCHEAMSRHEACHDSVTSHDLGGEQGPHWARRLGTEDPRGYQPHYTYYNSSLHVEV